MVQAHASHVRLGLRQADYFSAFLPLSALLQEIDALETFQDVAFGRDGAGAFQAAMLRHKSEMSGHVTRLR
jgi:hypothetical protein